MEKTKTPKRIISVLICMMIILLCIFVPASGISAETSVDEITVGIPKDRCPIFYQDDNTGEPVGIGVDLMREAAENAGYKVSFQFVKEANLKDALDNPEYDVVMPFGSAITSTEGKSTIVTDNLMQTPFTFVTIGNRELPKMNELRVGMVGSLSGGIETLKQFYPGMKIVAYDTMSECVNALRAGEVDALLHNSYIWSYVLQKPSYKDLNVQPSTVFSMDFCAGTLDSPEGEKMIERLNGGIAEIDDAFRQAVVLDYTSRSLYKNDFSDFIYQYGLIVLLGVLLFAAVIVIAVQRIRVIRKEQEEKMRQIIEYDSLTGICNMNGFRKRVEELLREHQDSPYFLSYNNIRNFKYINESLGRDAGDELLKFWASISLENLSDAEAIGRLEADHYVVLRKIAGEEGMREDEVNVLEPVRNYFINQGKETRIQLCSGIYVLTPKDFRKIDVDHMVDLARVAEERVRTGHKGDFAFYNPDQWETGKRIADIINFLPSAIQAGDIQVWYQPQMDSETGKITGAEALCRWDHAKLGWMRPPGFIETLEEAGLIYDLDCFVWETVCKDLQRWKEQGRYISVSVNVSRDDIREDRDLAGQFRNLIQTYGLTSDQLRIEITETAYVKNPDLLIGTTERLKEYGFQVEMDDFGSGYSSLHMLKEVPVDCIKLDLHFLTASGDPEKSRIIVSSMIQMVQQMEMGLIAEGVETVEQVQFLQEHGCSRMQGFYFYKPMPEPEFVKIMEEDLQ